MLVQDSNGIIHSNPLEDEQGLFPIYDYQEVATPLSETADEFLTQRGDWNLLKTLTGDGLGIKVGVGDTGVDKTHLDGDLKGVKNAKDFTGSRYDFYDRHSHGSHCTGHIGARRDGQGMVGLASSCDMVHAKVLGDNGSGSSTGIARGIRWMIDEKCHIISLSLGGGFSQEIENACRDAAEAGVFVLAAMGNNGTRGDGHPGNSRYTFGVVAVDYQKRLAAFSSRSKMAKYSGYGVNVMSCGLNGKYVRMSGTSMATPDQAGLLALYLSWRKKYSLPLPKTMEELEALLSPGVEDLGSPGWDIGYGLGFINIWKLIETTPTPGPGPGPSPEGKLGLGIVSTSDGFKVLGTGAKAELTIDGKKYLS
jgi:subtilisin